MCSKDDAIAHAEVNAFIRLSIDNRHRVLQYRIPDIDTNSIEKMLYRTILIDNAITGLVEYTVEYRRKLLTRLFAVRHHTETHSCLMVPRTAVATYLEAHCQRLKGVRRTGIYRVHSRHPGVARGIPYHRRRSVDAVVYKQSVGARAAGGAETQVKEFNIERHGIRSRTVAEHSNPVVIASTDAMGTVNAKTIDSRTGYRFINHSAMVVGIQRILLNILSSCRIATQQ